MRSFSAWKGLLLVAIGGCVESSVVRAQFTESAGTVPPGIWYLESDLLNAGGHTSDEGVRQRYLAAGYLQATLGISERLDLQIGVQAYQHEDLHEPGASRIRDARWGDVCVRSKLGMITRADGWNMALLPFVTLPLDRGDDGHRFAQLGLIVPFTRSSGDWCMDAQIQFDGSKHHGERRDWTWLASANLQRTWNNRWGTYIEVISDFSGDSSDPALSAGVGVTRAVGRGGWDIALYRGMTDEAMDWEVAVRLYWEI